MCMCVCSFSNKFIPLPSPPLRWCSRSVDRYEHNNISPSSPTAADGGSRKLLSTQVRYSHVGKVFDIITITTTTSTTNNNDSVVVGIYILHCYRWSFDYI